MIAEALGRSPLLALGIVLLGGALLGAASERLRIPWITGCILAGLALGPGGAGVLQGPALQTLGLVAQAALAVIAFGIGCELSWSRLSAMGAGLLAMAVAQLLAPFALVLAGEWLLGMSLGAALLVAAVAPMTAPTTTFSVIRRRGATGPFVDRALGILAVNDSAAVLLFSVASALALGLLAAGAGGATLGGALLHALTIELASLALGAGLGLAWVGLQRLLDDGRPGAESRLVATLMGLLLAGIGAAIGFGLSHLLVPLGIGLAVANGGAEPLREQARALLQRLQEPLFIAFFVLAGAHLPLVLAEHPHLLLAALVYLACRLGGKLGAIFGTGLAQGLDPPTRRWLGFCFPSQGGLAMGAAMALHGSAAVRALPPEAAEQVDRAVSLVLLAVLLSQLFGPSLIDLALRRGGAVAAAPPDAAEIHKS